MATKCGTNIALYLRSARPDCKTVLVKSAPALHQEMFDIHQGGRAGLQASVEGPLSLELVVRKAGRKPGF
jgi:hypothetical protein